MIQKAVEKAGISTILITHLPELTEKVDPPRALHLKFPLGRSFGAANRNDLQRKIVVDMLNAIVEMDETEKIRKLPYRWRRD
uniref:Uncharacterized protein n=1 Tax=Anaerobacillus isosaccharinicus TaxID=1532552 RepID=A0A7S7RDR1_9BACI|nr:hypothetical protein [Anaerobacillus isosaccharinicus]QOY38314.1 hypothetical protein AWH56_012725 [Anaerobacillus isosaccharinicus]